MTRIIACTHTFLRQHGGCALYTRNPVQPTPPVVWVYMSTQRWLRRWLPDSTAMNWSREGKDRNGSSPSGRSASAALRW